MAFSQSVLVGLVRSFMMVGAGVIEVVVVLTFWKFMFEDDSDELFSIEFESIM